MANQEREPLLPVRVAAREYGVHEETLRDWCRKGVIPHVRVGPPPGLIRLRRSDLERTIRPEDLDR